MVLPAMTRDMALTRDELIARIAEAYETYRRLPDPDRKYRVQLKSSWPAYVRDAAECYGYNDERVSLARPTPAEITRTEELMDVMGAALKLHVAGAYLLWFSYGGGLPMAECIIACVQKGQKRMSKRSAFRKRDVALEVLLSAINKTVPKSAKACQQAA